MKKIRIIPRLDVKGPNVVKGIQLEGLRVVGNPRLMAKNYYEQGADEIIYMDIVASLYQRNNLTDIVRETSKDVFVPMTVGGGIRTIEDVSKILRAGADKVAINTAATKNPKLITEVAKRFGSQCMVLSIEAKKGKNGKWEAYTDNGRNHTGLEAVSWAKKAVDLGAGEILLTSVDNEGREEGFALELMEEMEDLPVPVIVSGGAGSVQDIVNCVKAGADAVAVASLLHYGKITIPEIKENAKKDGILVREIYG